MQKPTKYSFSDSNIANLGTELERNCKKTAAECEREWHTAGKTAGIQIWRIMNFKVVPVPPANYGQFYDGDSYIILRTYGEAPKWAYDLYFWLGKFTSQDEAGTAAYKTVELDTFFDDVPVQYREVQGHESERFLANFPHGIRVMSGGVDSGFHHVKPEEYQPRLLRAKGKGRDIRMTQVELARASLNSGDVFILDAGLKVWQWNGSKSTGMERNKAGTVARAIDDERGGKAEVIVVDESAGSNGNDEFWALLGGRGDIKSAEEGDRETSPQEGTKALFRLSDASGSLHFEQVAKGHVTRDLLRSNDVFIFDTGKEVFAWVGRGASADEKRKALGFAQNYLGQYNRPVYLPICRVLEGGENEVFEAAFDH
eukprot:TRINITY_DN5791_c0_g1_i1.p1 TRINITY_DN5791_c0_g1~~TRINITY_DN5791_c0_g1_i1.p1  ORF type:complete len:370 (-),score=62.75 TRINITY_DN5791_c0_g1_i1:267-1376(-)